MGPSTPTTKTIVDFQYFNVNDVDPTFQALPTDVYTLRINKMTSKTYAAKSGDGTTYPVVKGDFTIVNHSEFAGRRLFETFWLNRSSQQKSLRRIQDATGIAQEMGEGTFEAWLERLSTEQPEFRVPVLKVEGESDNKIVWKDIQPAS